MLEEIRVVDFNARKKRELGLVVLLLQTTNRNRSVFAEADCA